VIVRTVLGDIDPADLDLTLGHEHIYAVPPAEVTDPDLHLDDEKLAQRELELFAAAGGHSVIEMTTVDYGRDAAVMTRISAASGVHLIAATGYNKGKFADRISSTLTTEAIAAWMIEEVEHGMAGSTARAGLIKASSSLDGPNPNERRVFEAAAAAHLATHAPISTHTEQGTWAIGQVQLLGDNGVPANRILLGHLDLKPDLGYLREVAATGAFLGLDQFAKAKYLSDADRIALVLALVADDHGHQLMLSGDMARRSYHLAHGGGPGFVHIPATILPALQSAGLSTTQIENLATGNTRRFLAFDPVGR
jgi:predicted metal-dependent phosphotriesterase family hydrolase